MADPQLDELLPDQAPFMIAADDTGKLHDAPKRSHVVRDVGGPAHSMGFMIETDNGHGRFRRNPVDASDDELVQHHIADDEH